MNREDADQASAKDPIVTGPIESMVEWERPQPEPEGSTDTEELSKKGYEKKLAELQLELVRLQGWVEQTGKRVAVLFEGRDTAGKGGTIKRITEKTNPRTVRTVALGTPTDREKTEWYFQRYVAHLPTAGEIVLFDRSWYNRAGVERVMDFCTEAEYQEFLRSAPRFERLLLNSGLILVKYWLSISDEEQEKRFKKRMKDPMKRWKLSPMDLEARARWVDYAEAKDVMFEHTDTKESPWYVVEADDKKTLRLNLISHLLSLIPYHDVGEPELELPPRQERDYKRPPQSWQTIVPERYEVD